MKKNKFLKSLAAITMSAVSAFALAAAGCGDDTAHTHKWGGYISDGASGHHRECSDCDDKDTGNHVYDNDTDTTCNLCDYVREVSSPVVNVTGVTLDKANATVGLGLTLTLVATVAPENATDKSITWSSSDATIASVKDGVVTGVKEGTATITVTTTDGNKTASCEVKVELVKTTATFELIPSELDAKKYDTDYSSGIYTIIGGTTIRTRARENYDVYDLEDKVVEQGFTASKSIQYNGSAVGFGINAPAAGKLYLYLDNGSSGLQEGDFQTIVLTKPDSTTETISYPAKKLRRYEIDIEEAGYYTLTRGSGGTTDIYYVKFETEVTITPVSDMKIVGTGNTEYYVGQDLDLSKLQIQITHSGTGMIESVALNDSRLTIDTSKYNKNVAGTYEIVVTFKEGENTFTDKFTVTVSEVGSIELGFNAIKQGNSGYNGTYENVAVRQFYFTGEKIDLSGLSVYTVLKDSTLKTLVTEGYTTNVDSIDMSTAGKKEVTISWGSNITEKFNIYVAAKPSISGNTVNVKVDGNLAESSIGTAANGAYQFKTIQQSLEFLGGLGLDENVKKVINLAEGKYFEKVEVNIPNLTIKGANSDATKTVIEYDALFGETDESGFVHTTDSTATLNVRVKATGFVIEDVTISNAWNSTAYFDEHKGTGYGEHRALAALFQADKVVVDNCRLLGYQDTVEFFTGRQYVLNSFIQGRTDFIFGTNNTTYFYNCEIHSIVSSGYVTAFKGNNKGADDAVTYGAIFDNCDFTAADGVTAGSTALGRPWGAYAAVAVINSKIGGHISTAAATGASSGTRYVTMSNNNPYDANVKFVEYNNSGAGAISEAVKGMKMLSATDAANYGNISVIFGKNNGGVKYTDAWDGGKGVQITEKTYKFSDYYASGDSYNSFHAATNEDIFGGDATVVSGKWGHELNQNKDHAKFDVGTVIKFNKVGEVSVTAYGGNYGLLENVKITYKDGYATITIIATDSSPIANGCYLTSFTIDMTKTPADTVA